MSQDDLQIRIHAITEGVQEAIGQVQALESAVASGESTAGRAGTQYAAMGDKLEAAFGGSSRAVNRFGGAIAEALGLTGPFGYAIDILIEKGIAAATSFGLMAGAVVVLQKAIEQYNKTLAESAAAEGLASRIRTAGSPVDAREIQLQAQLDALQKQRAEAEKSVAGAAWYGGTIYDAGMLDKSRQALDDVNQSINDTQKQLEALKIYGSDAASVMVTFADESLRAARAQDDAAASMQRFMALRANSEQLNAGGGPTFEDMSLVDSAAWQSALNSATQDRIDKEIFANGKIADDWRRQMQAQAEAFHASLVGQAESMLTVSQVTSQDLKDTAAGKYKDKNDENIRRLRLYPEIDSDIFKKLPQDIQNELKAAFEQGGGAYKLKITDLIQKGESFADSRLWDLDKMGADLRAQVEAEQRRKALAEEVVKRSGLDMSNATVMAQANKLTGADPTGVGGMMADAQKQIEQFKPANALAQAFQADKDNIIKAGRKLGEFVVSGLKDQITDAVEDISTQFMKALTGSLDGRYVRQPKTFGVTQ